MSPSKKRLNIGTKLQVMNGTAQRTSGGLKKRDLTRNKRGKVVSMRMRGGDINTIKTCINTIKANKTVSNENKASLFQNWVKELGTRRNTGNTGNSATAPKESVLSEEDAAKAAAKAVTFRGSNTWAPGYGPKAKEKPLNKAATAAATTVTEGGPEAEEAVAKAEVAAREAGGGGNGGAEAELTASEKRAAATTVTNPPREAGAGAGAGAGATAGAAGAAGAGGGGNGGSAGAGATAGAELTASEAVKAVGVVRGGGLKTKKKPVKKSTTKPKKKKSITKTKKKKSTTKKKSIKKSTTKPKKKKLSTRKK